MARPWRPSTTQWSLLLVTLMGGVAAVLATWWMPVPASFPREAARVAVPAAAVRPSAPPAVEEQRLLEVPVDTALTINAERPFAPGPLLAARPYRFAGSPEALARATDCLAAAGWYEVGDDPTGERSVMQVVLNRARHPAFPGSVCGVVFQGSERTTGCQFTFTCDGSMVRRTPPADAWARSRALAAAALAGAVDPSVGTATHYHADYVVPYWAAANDKIAKVGLHIFYRWKGFWGTRAAFTRAPGTEEPGYAALARLSPAHGAVDAPLLPMPVIPVDTAAAGAAVPPPVAVEGVREKSLRGAVVRAQGAPAGSAANQFFLQLDGATFPGNYATAAVALCKGRPTCLVLGWRDAGQMAQALPLGEAARGALSFMYAQGADGAGRAMWNCQQTPRTNSTQCLPAGGGLPAVAS